MQQTAKGALVGRVLVDVGNPELWLPQERVVGALEYLALFGDRMDDGLQRRAPIGDAEPARLEKKLQKPNLKLPKNL